VRGSVLVVGNVVLAPTTLTTFAVGSLGGNVSFVSVNGSLQYAGGAVTVLVSTLPPPGRATVVTLFSASDNITGSAPTVAVDASEVAASLADNCQRLDSQTRSTSTSLAVVLSVEADEQSSQCDDDSSGGGGSSSPKYWIYIVAAVAGACILLALVAFGVLLWMRCTGRGERLFRYIDPTDRKRFADDAVVSDASFRGTGSGAQRVSRSLHSSL
jgi:hypothetical protein